MDEPDRDQRSDAAKREEAILAFWRDNGIFEKSLAKDAPNGDFVFYEGPPTANGMPGVHHLESRAFKDAIPRYKTMRGYRVRRRGGWDTHGLPVELEVEKKRGFTGKQDIEAYGVAAFNAQCRESVLSYIREWQRFSDRMGYWVDQENAYFTFDPKYMESLWSILKKVDDDELLYKDYRVLPWCPVCGTALSSHELAQGYEEVKDLSLTVKLKIENPEKLGYSSDSKVYFLAWTTTPWTLPGNVALAVGKEIDYVLWTDSRDGVVESYIVAAERFNALGVEAVTVPLGKGNDLVRLGLTYRPLYPFAEALASETEKPKFAETAFRIHAADFVTTDSGTGIVHTAVMYGQDDFELGQKVGLPKVHLVGADGKFLPGTGFLEGRYVHEQDEKGKPTLAVDIVDDLKRQGAYFAQENYKHTYPHCWRSKNRLIYYARDSWYIRMTALKDQLIAANATVNWEPAHIREGRMGEWLANVRDWAISRERYWGTPLPVWQSEDGAERVVIGSVDDLKKRTKTNGNRFIAMRHGEAMSNASGMLNSHVDTKNPLTEAGRTQVTASARTLQDAGITRIVASPFERTRETAAIVAAELGLPETALTYDERLREFDFGELDGQSYEQFVSYYAQEHVDRVTNAVPGGESYADARRRFGAVLYDLEASHQGETILIVTHGVGVESLLAIAEGADDARFTAIIEAAGTSLACVQPLLFVPLPHDEEYRLDLHRPFIDDVVLVGDSGKELRRVKEVLDVWFDSGAMPFAQDHYPFENREWIESAGYPADFISEAIDQTRGWFYTLLAIGVLMGKGAAYRNVICLGHLLDEHGLKMSKSKGNIIEPMAAMDRYGADTLRFWMYYVNQPGDSKSFDEKTVKEAARVISWLENSAKFYALHRTDAKANFNAQEIDFWIQSRMGETTQLVTEALDAYDLYGATRALAKYFEDLSQWYVRRIRDRARDGDEAALASLSLALHTGVRLMAPFTPFIAESIFQEIRHEDDPESVHLTAWPDATHRDNSLLDSMQTVRTTASNALKLRNQVGIPVRQPLTSLTITDDLPDALKVILAEEVNVESVLVGEALALDTTITDELLVKGDERIMQRAVAEARKAEGLDPKEQASVEHRDDGPYLAELSTGPVRFVLVRA